MHILVINIHGLVRSENVEFGRDADTGGQTRYVIDLVKNLSQYPEISQIDLATRLVRDKTVSADYSRQEEIINDSCKIIRFGCGNSKYLRKEKLWPHLDEFTDRIISYISAQRMIPDLVYGHYADAGYVAMQIASIFGIPFVFAGHSLGKNKLSYLLANGWTEEKADKDFTIRTRIKTEEEIMLKTDLVVASTEYERDKLYGMYNNSDAPEYVIIPPGLDLEQFFPYYEYEMPGNAVPEVQKQAQHRMSNELKRFHFNSDKPVILSLCRPDARKNIDVLIDIYGQDRELQAMANLAIFAGIRSDINEMPEAERQVLTDILLQMDKYDLYGKIAIPKNHNPETEVPELYRIAALKKGVFVSASYLETFGLTFVEASAAGLPFIATEQGGPADIVNNCHSGILVDIANKAEVGSRIKKILSDSELWTKLSENGINNARKIYTWEHHCTSLIGEFNQLINKKAEDIYKIDPAMTVIGKRLEAVTHLLIADIDDTLTGDKESLELLKIFLAENNGWLGFGVATGRNIESAQKILAELGVPAPDIAVTSVGTEIYYPETMQDKGWTNHIGRDWKPERISRVLEDIPCIAPQKNLSSQRKFKISYDFDTNCDPGQAIPDIHAALAAQNLRYILVFSHGCYIDILPCRASKGKAIRYLSGKWRIPAERIFTAGNSGNDYDMLTGRLNGIVVANHDEDLKPLKKNTRTYFAEKKHAGGILEGIRHFMNKT
ncbi:MAG: HAD-IIB family hydrolase [Spirochaetales bacterium]|nr:HAD-IIB family hydrolase [Spirochaetales bacterium]